MIAARDQLVICFAHAAYQMKACFDALNTGIASFEVRERDEFERRAPEADVIVVCGMWHNGLIPLATRLRFIQSIGSGTYQFDQRLALSDAEGARLFFLRAQVIEEVLYRLRAGEWDSQHFQAGSLTPTPLPADWWKQRTYLDPYNETVPWEGGELTRLMVEEQAPAGSLIGANDDAPPVDKAAARKRPPLAAPARPKQKAKKRKRLDYSGDDAPLVTQMRAGIRNGTYTGPLNAARAFAGQAKGKGGEDSKALRLCRRLKD